MKLNEAIELVLAAKAEYVNLCESDNTNNDIEIALEEKMLGAIEVMAEVFEEYKKNRKVKEFEDTQVGKLFDLLDKNPNGLDKDNILEIMGITKGNFGSIVMGMRKKNIGIVKIGNKYVLEKYVKIGE